jgi:hypothetical protein
MYATDIIYSDLNIPQLESLPITQPHRTVDITVANADKEGEIACALNVNNVLDDL